MTVDDSAAGLRMVAFFPWLRLTAAVAADDFTLVPYSVREQTQTPTEFDLTFRNVLSQFSQYVRLGEPPTPLEDCTILVLKGTQPGEPFTEPQMIVMGELVEAVAFAGLAHREFHQAHGRYCSYAQFQLIIQSFKGAPAATWVTRRRRDGYINALISKGTVHVRPQETESLTVSLDETLLNAILRARSTADDWPRLFEAIVQFNAANSDAGRVPPFFEVVASLGSLGRCLALSWKDRENEWVNAFEKRFKARIPSSPASNQFGHATPDDSVRMHWLRQFYRTRNKYAHGGINAANTDWTTEDHLLIAASVVPLAMKFNLIDLADYQWTEDDNILVDALERRILSVRSAAPVVDPEEGHPWAGAAFDAVAEVAAQRLEAVLLQTTNAEEEELSPSPRQIRSDP